MDIFTIYAALSILAVGGTTSDRTLIIIAVLGSVTSVLVSVFNNRKLDKVASLPKEVQELKISLDGRLQELMETKEKAAHSAGAEQERTEERDRQGSAAIGVKAASPTPVIVANPKDNPAHVKPVQ